MTVRSNHFPGNGFTLLELSVVLAIVALVTGMAMTSGVSVLATSRQSATLTKMAAIEQALMAFRLANDRLPCPGDLAIGPTGTNSQYYGQESPNLGNCGGNQPQANFGGENVSTSYRNISHDAEGSVPAVTLGLPADFMYDGWGNHFNYAVDSNLTYTGQFSGNVPGVLCGSLNVLDALGNTRTNKAAYVLLSHGPNGHGAVSAYNPNYRTTLQGINAGSVNANELINCHCTNSGAYDSLGTGSFNSQPYFVQAPPFIDTTNPLNSFDDIVVFKERWQLQAPWESPLAPYYIYVADTGNNRAQKYDSCGNFSRVIGSGSGSGSGYMSSPGGIAVDSSGNIWVSDTGNNRLQKFTSAGVFSLAVGGGSPYTCSSGSPPACVAGTATSQFSTTMGNLALDASGNVWVADTGNNRIQQFNSSGTWLQSIPASGTTASSLNGKLSGPTSIAVDSSGYIWVVDGGNNRMEKFNSSGTFQAAYDGPSPPGNCTTSPGSACTADGVNNHFQSPKWLAIDGNGGIWVWDAVNKAMQFDSSGTWVHTYDFDHSMTFTGGFQFDMAKIEAWVPAYGGTPARMQIGKYIPWYGSTPTELFDFFSDSGSANGLLGGPPYPGQVAVANR